MAKIKLRINKRGEATWRFPANTQEGSGPKFLKVNDKHDNKVSRRQAHRNLLRLGLGIEVKS